MPKDPTRNQPNYKIGGDHINEYDYENNKGQMTKEEENQLPRSEQNQQNSDSASANKSGNSNAQSSSQ